MLLLSLDTCDSRGSVCVVRDGLPGACLAHTSVDDYSNWLIPATLRCLEEARSSLAQVDVFAVATGPGSFTGVRVGLTTVKGLAEAFGRPIAAVSRLFAVATAVSGAAECLAAVVDASRGEIFAALYRQQSGILVLHGDERVCSPAEFLSAVGRVVAGPIRWATPDPGILTREQAWNSRARAGDEIEIVTPVFAPVIGRVGYQQFLRGELVDSVRLDANYIRRPDAEKFWKAPRPAHGS